MKKTKWWLIAIVVVLMIISAGWMLVVQLEGENPVITESIPESLGQSQTFTFTFSDERSGLRKVRILLLKDGKQWNLFEKQFEKTSMLGDGQVHETSVDVPVDLDELGISDGDAVMQITLWDYSWRNWWHGNKTHIEKALLIDSKPPEIEIISKAHNINQGGAGLVIYRLSEFCPKSGVVVGDNFFPGHSGYFNNELIHLAFFALEYNQGPGTKIIMEASDRGSNTTRAGFYHHLRRKNFAKDVIRLSDRFFNYKVPEFNVRAPENSSNPMLDKFLEINRSLRKENEAFLKTIGLKTETEMYWEGTFLRLPNAANRAGFADQREYRYNGEVVDNQVHLGIDLASFEKSPVPASNTGRVVYADDIGIYGKTVVLDHGFGLMSMYSHLSGIDVETGQMVSKGQILGRTGVTGLAGGDHLHYGMMIHNIMINPIEWWDSNWIMHNVTEKLKDAKALDTP
ncbi:MAG: M23 family metallopeptidase [Desulfobacterales bacterium]